MDRPDDSTPRLWQLPTFLVGIACLVGLWYEGGKLRPSLHERYIRALSQLKPAVERASPSADQLQAALRRFPSVEPPAPLAIKVHYFMGSAHVALAELTTSSAEANEHWQTARKHLEAIPESIPTDETGRDVDPKKLKYRLARVWANSEGVDPQKIIKALSEGLIGSGEDPAEGHRLLADLCLKLNPPDEAMARDNLQGYLKYVSTRVDARTLNEARVRLAELHGKLHETEEARKVLERVGPEAPPEIYANARLQLAKYLQSEDRWNQALEILTQVRDMHGASLSQKNQALSQLSDVYMHLNRSGDARQALEQIGRESGPAGRMKAFRMAEMKLNDPKVPLPEIVESLEGALRELKGPEEITSDVMPISEVRKVCLTALTRTKEANEPKLTLRLAKSYEKIAEDSRYHQWSADAQEAIATHHAKDPSRVKDAQEHYRQAAEECRAMVPGLTLAVEKGDALRRSSSLYLKADDRAKAIQTLTELTTQVSEYPDDKMGQAWAEMGDIYFENNELEQAKLAYQNAAGRVGPAQARSRVRFAMIFFQADPKKGLAAASTLLEEVVKSTDPSVSDKATHEEAIYSLGSILCQVEEWKKAEEHLRVALDTYPSSSRAAKGRLQLGQSLRAQVRDEWIKMAQDEAEIKQIEYDRRKLREPNHRVTEQIKLQDRISATKAKCKTLLKESFECVRKAEEDFLMQAKPADAKDLRLASFFSAECLLQLGRLGGAIGIPAGETIPEEFKESAHRYEKLVNRYKNHPSSLEGLRDLIFCSQAAAQACDDVKDVDGMRKWKARVQETRVRLKDTFTTMPLSAFDNSQDSFRQAYWEKWIENNIPSAAVAAPAKEPLPIIKSRIRD